MKQELKKFPKMSLVSTVYGNDDTATSTSVTQGLLEQYPNLKGIISPTTVGIAAAAAVLDSAKYRGKVMLTGLGTPDEMKAYVKDGTVKSFELWNPADLGYLAAYAAVELASGSITGAAGQPSPPASSASSPSGPATRCCSAPPTSSTRPTSTTSTSNHHFAHPPTHPSPHSTHPPHSHHHSIHPRPAPTLALAPARGHPARAPDRVPTCQLRQRPQTESVGYANDTNRRCQWRSRQDPEPVDGVADRTLPRGRGRAREGAGHGRRPAPRKAINDSWNASASSRECGPTGWTSTARGTKTSGRRCEPRFPRPAGATTRFS